MSLPQWDPSGWRDYQQQVRLYKTGENLEVNWSVAARLVGGLRGAAQRVCLAMTDQELLPTARNITDNWERKADRNRRGIEALMTRLEAELGQQKKGESLEMFFASNKLQRKRGEHVTDYITRFEEGIKTLQDNEINLLTIDDVPGWMLMRKASLTQERRERLIFALPDEHFAIPELHINEHRESDGHSRRSRNDHTGPSSSYQRREQMSYPRRYRSNLATGHERADTDSVDDETDVTSADLQGFVRSELEALSAGIDDFPSDPSSVFTQDESSRLENAAMDLSSVPEALMTIRAARDKMKGKSEGKGELAVSFSGKGRGKWRKPNSAKHLQDKLAARKSKSTQRGHWAGDPQCPGNQDTNFTNWPDDQSFPDREDSRTIMAPCSNLREHSVCTNSVSNFRCPPADAHISVSLVVTGTVHPTRSVDSQECCRSVVENSEPSASKSDLGLGIIDTACFFCVAGSDWWANYKSLLEDFGLKHEIDETREAERYKFGDGGTLVSSIRVTAPVFVAGKKGRILFQRGSFETPALVDWSRFPDSCPSCCGYG